MKCQCANERKPDQTKAAWRWGGCSDNVKHGKRVTRNFLDLHLGDIDNDEDEISKHNSEVSLLIYSYKEINIFILKTYKNRLASRQL